jgi:hypothetical protein
LAKRQRASFAIHSKDFGLFSMWVLVSAVGAPMDARISNAAQQQESTRLEVTVS